MLMDLEGIEVRDELLTRILLTMYPPSTSVRADGNSIEARSAIQDVFLDAKKRSGYALWHAVCAHLDHTRGISRVVNGRRLESRMNSILWAERSLKREKLGAILLKALIV